MAHAGADVRPKGGMWTFKTASIGLRKAGGRWQLDRLKVGTLDRAALSSASDELPDGVDKCLLRVLRTREDKELVRAIVEPDVRVLLLPSLICGVRPLYRRGRAGITRVSCVVSAARKRRVSEPALVGSAGAQRH